MCGIFGYFHKEKIPSLAQINVHDILQHRGPDDTGWLLFDGSETVLGRSSLPDRSANLLLLHKRLSILDLSTSGWQPMACLHRRYHLIFNGEIYNYVELREELSKKGVSFSSKSDSEVLLQAYIHWGKACLNKIEGMFSFVIFDKQERVLFIARDPFGIKPFYYYADGYKLLFSSEIKSLLNFLPSKKLNSQRVFFYLRSGMTDFENETLFSGLKQLPAGHYLEIDLCNFQTVRPISYWTVKSEKNLDISFSEAAATVRDLFLKSLELHLRSDVTVAATLSGGIDSSAIVMGIRHLYPQLGIQTLSYIADEANLSEEKWIDMVNAKANATSHKVFASPENLIDDLEQLICVQDEPFGSTSIYAQHRVFNAAKNLNIKVMLDGQGADEMLGGYVFYTAARFVSLLKQFKFKEALQLLLSTRQYLGNSLIFNSLHYLLPPTWQVPLRRFSGNHYVPLWLNKTWFNDNNVTFSPFKSSYGKQVLHEELIHTFSHSSLPMLLRYEDRNSMAHSIESRVPFLTKDLVEFIFTLPENFLVAENGLSKAVFRKAMEGIVPDSILQRRDKIGFATPEKSWLSILKPWVEKTLTSHHAKQLPMFNHNQLIEDWQKMLQGKSNFDFRFWRWINFIKWTELHQVEV